MPSQTPAVLHSHTCTMLSWLAAAMAAATSLGPLSFGIWRRCIDHGSDGQVGSPNLAQMLHLASANASADPCSCCTAGSHTTLHRCSVPAMQTMRMAAAWGACPPDQGAAMSGRPNRCVVLAAVTSAAGSPPPATCEQQQAQPSMVVLEMLQPPPIAVVCHGRWR